MEIPKLLIQRRKHLSSLDINSSSVIISAKDTFDDKPFLVEEIPIYSESQGNLSRAIEVIIESSIGFTSLNMKPKLKRIGNS